MGRIVPMNTTANSLDSISTGSRTSFLPASSPRSDETQPISAHPPAWNATWWKRLLNLVTHLLWMGGLLALIFLCHALTPTDKPDLGHACVAGAVITFLAFSFQWSMLYIIEGRGFNAPARIWAIRIGILAAALMINAGVNYAEPTVRPLVGAQSAAPSGFIAPVEDRINYLESSVQEESKTAYDILIQDDVWSPNSADAIAVRTRGITSRSYGWWQAHVLSNEAIPAQDRTTLRASVDNAFQMVTEANILKTKPPAEVSDCQSRQC